MENTLKNIPQFHYYNLGNFEEGERVLSILEEDIISWSVVCNNNKRDMRFYFRTHLNYEVVALLLMSINYPVGNLVQDF